ncbi:hypothetical protein FY550_06630 [Kushneria phosphatilytica]|uniref:Uncharacterized protein n=1 Tax=Kushneria phosphatilytica TaxID=657387 RepID=A0A5C0ZXW5_9GAMM|nr:hypothetical protein [Kushneria phosphatilytica]QEL10828.1 hypothetical protein FY550_06630 [Kushneria phosphatilytica]
MSRTLRNTLVTLCLLVSAVPGTQADTASQSDSARQQRFDNAQQQQRIQRLQSDIHRREHRMSAGTRTGQRLEEQSLRQDRQQLREERRNAQRPSPDTNRQVHPSSRQDTSP